MTNAVQPQENKKQPYFIIEDLDYIFIRALDKENNWSSLSLNQIADEQFVEWVKTKGLKEVRDTSDITGTPWTKQQKIDVLNYLHDHGVIIHMIRREKRKSWEKMSQEEK